MRPAALLPLVVLLSAGCPGTPPGDETPSDGLGRPLSELIACNDSVVGGDALRRLEWVEFDLHIAEPSFEAVATYRAERKGTVRIDVFSDGTRVFSEGWDGSTAWQMPQGIDEPQPTSPDAAAPLRHGLEQPGHLWTVRDMSDYGHTVEEDASVERPAGARVVHLTLRDGFESWLWVDTSTCFVTRRRDFRAFHPDVDSTRTWIETRFADFRAVDGVTRAWSTYSVDLSTGDTIGVTTLTAVRGAPVP